MQRRLWILSSVLVPMVATADASADVHALGRQVAALRVDHALNLTPQQAQVLLPILQAARAQREASRPAVASALAMAVSDLKATGAVSEGTARAMAAARPSGGPNAGARSLWQQARQVLTPAQLEALRTTPLGVSPAGTPAAPEGRRAGPGRRLRLMHALLSEDFLALVQARAG